MAEGLGVVDNGWSHVKSHGSGEVGGLDSRVGALAFKRFDQTGFFATNIGGRATVDVDFEIKTGPLNVLAKEAFFPGFSDGPFQSDGGLGKLLANVNVSGVSSNGIGRDDHALNELVRILVDDIAVLEGARL